MLLTSDYYDVYIYVTLGVLWLLLLSYLEQNDARMTSLSHVHLTIILNCWNSVVNPCASTLYYVLFVAFFSFVDIAILLLISLLWVAFAEPDTLHQAVRLMYQNLGQNA